jgi:hypothetical protein
LPWYFNRRIITGMTDEEFQTRLASLPGPPYFEEWEAAAFDLFKVGTREQKAMLLEMRRNIPSSLRLTPERRISRALRSSLNRTVEGAEFMEAPEFRGIGIGLENFLSSRLAEAYPYWEHESLDGFSFCEAQKTGPYQAELFGVCILISDQTVTPIHVRLKVSPSEDKIDWMECNLGKRGTGEGGMERVPWPRWRNNRSVGLPKSKDLVDWVYKIIVGERALPA